MNLLPLCLSLFLYGDHGSLIVKNDWGHRTAGAGAECRVKRWSFTGKLGTPVLPQDNHEDDGKDWRFGRAVGGAEVRFYFK